MHKALRNAAGMAPRPAAEGGTPARNRPHSSDRLIAALFDEPGHRLLSLGQVLVQERGCGRNVAGDGIRPRTEMITQNSFASSVRVIVGPNIAWQCPAIFVKWLPLSCHSSPYPL